MYPQLGCVSKQMSFVHNPYSFGAYDVVSDPPMPTSPSSDHSSFASDPTSVGSQSVLSDDAMSPGSCSPEPPLYGVGAALSTELVPDFPLPAAGVIDTPQYHDGKINAGGSSPESRGLPRKHSAAHGSASPAAAPRTPPTQWRRYGAAVSQMEALKDLQEFTRQHPLPPAPTPAMVWVAPPSAAAPAALPLASTSPARLSLTSVPPLRPRSERHMRAILRELTSPAPRLAAHGPQAAPPLSRLGRAVSLGSAAADRERGASSFPAAVSALPQ
eukprot:GGOE01011944.1.p1 GENE.GGOE01011944.1~~GGOE01011944.1.p1  ORF type:complete len:311 (+),score=29.55 GGOE01011944.1:120-935(+)